MTLGARFTKQVKSARECNSKTVPTDMEISAGDLRTTERRQTQHLIYISTNAIYQTNYYLFLYKQSQSGVDDLLTAQAQNSLRRVFRW